MQRRCVSLLVGFVTVLVVKGRSTPTELAQKPDSAPLAAARAAAANGKERPVKPPAKTAESSSSPGPPTSTARVDDPPDASKRYRVTGRTIGDGAVMSTGKLEDGINVELTKPGILIGNLTFSEARNVKILSDDTLLAEKEDITATDASGNTWRSRKVMA